MANQVALQDANRFPGLIAHTGTAGTAEIIRVVANAAGALSTTVAFPDPVGSVTVTSGTISTIGTLPAITIGTIPGIGTLTNIGSLTNVGSIAAGVLTSLGTLPGVGSLTNLGSVTNIGSVAAGVLTSLGTLLGQGTLTNVGSITNLGSIAAGILTSVTSVGSVVGMGTITKLGSITNIGSIAAGVLTSLGTTTGIGTVSNLGSLNTVATVTNLINGSVNLLTGTVTSVTNLAGGTVQINPIPIPTPLIIGTLGTAGGSFFATLSAASGAGTKHYISGLSIVQQSGTADVRILTGTAIQGTGVLAAGFFSPSGGMVREFNPPFVTGTNSELTCHFVGAGTAFIVVNYWKGA